MQSLERCNPSWDRYTVLVDNIQNYVGVDENFTVIPVEELGLVDLNSFFRRYDILEANTAVKPWAFEKLFNKGYDNVIYFDPDIEVYTQLKMESELNNNLMLLTPHILESIVDDIDNYDDVRIILAGIYNLGFIALSKHEDLKRFLSWWKGKLEYHCLNDPSLGYFVDQKWMDLAPVLFKGVVISNDESYNVAYWNIVERKGVEPSFFHFSGINLKSDKYLSVHRKSLLLSNCSEIIQTKIKEYKNSLLKNDYLSCSTIKYGYKKDVKGTYSGIYNKDNYRLYDKYVWMSESSEFNDYVEKGILDIYVSYIKDYYKDPLVISIFIDDLLVKDFVLENKESVLSVDIHSTKIHKILIKSSHSFVPEKIGLNSDNRTLSIGIWKIQNNDNVIFNFEKREYFKKELLSERRPLKIGYNLIGYMQSEAGTSQTARYIADSLDRLHIQYSIMDIEGDLSNRKYNTNIFFVNGDFKLSNTFDSDLFDGCKNIGYWCWETENVPVDWYENEDVLDEIWTISNFCQNAISLKSNIPVLTVIPQLDFNINDDFDFTKYGIVENTFKFLFIYDSNSVTKRKNPEAVIESFLTAKKSDKFKDAILIIKTNSNEINSYKRDDIIIINEVLSRQETYELHNIANCFISLHRAEGLGLNILEALYLGKPVIATGWSGNVELVNYYDNYHLVDYKLIKIGVNYSPYKEDDIWAEPNISHAAELMIEVLSDKNIPIKSPHCKHNIDKLLLSRLDT